MKPRRILSPLSPSLRGVLSLATTFAISFAGSHLASAASDTWDGSTDATWATGTNWLADPAIVPGTLETATFNGAGNGNTVINLGSGVAIGTVLFDTASAAAYTIGSGGAGSQTLTFDDTGVVTMNATVANNQLFNSNIVLGTGIAGTTTITNLTTGATAKNITFNGTVTGGTGGTAGAKTVVVSTLAGGTVNFTNAFSAGGSTGVNLNTFQSANNDVTHTGTVTLSGAVSSSFLTLRATGGGSMVVDGQTVTVSANSTYGNTTTYGKFFLNSGSAAFNGGIGSATSGGNPAGADGMAFIVNGGTFSASSLTMGRSQNTGNSTTFFTTAIGMGTSGFQVNGGTASITGALRIAGGGSSATGQVTGTGSLTVGGEMSIGELVTRSSLFQVTGGTFTSTDAVGNGIVIAKGTAAAAAAGQLLLTGGTTTTEKISFGLNGGLAGSTGNLTINGANANLYIGSGGIVNNATNAITTTINLMNGTLGAKSDWLSSMNMSLGGAGVTIKAADASNVAKNVALTGVISGANGFTKTGGGILTLSGVNTYTGATTVSAGTLATSSTATLGFSNIAIADGAILTLNSAFSIGDANTLTFGSASAINMDFTGSDTLASITRTGGSTLSTPGVYSAADLNTFFGGSSFASTTGGTFTVVPEPSTAILGGLGLLALLRRRRA